MVITVASINAHAPDDFTPTPRLTTSLSRKTSHCCVEVEVEVEVEVAAGVEAETVIIIMTVAPLLVLRRARVFQMCPIKLVV